MIDRPNTGERGFLVHVLSTPGDDPQGVRELTELSSSAGIEICERLSVRVRKPDPRYYIGPGKVGELAETIAAQSVDIVVVNQALSPAQERNLEGQLKCRVLDRIGLILAIFARRASTFEGKLQVELAQLRHLSTRLVRGWTHLERQKGGIGLRGPGEKQLETDRRLIQERIRHIGLELERVSKRRQLSKKARRRAGLPVLSLVGYTNAGKSTLFNALSGASALAHHQLFATLDPVFRRISLNPGDDVILVDTVGFIRDLPHELVAAFRATLEETRDADLLLHVVDASAVDRDEKIEQVDQVLTSIGAGEVPQLRIMNKTDALRTSPMDIGASQSRCDEDAAGRLWRVWISARKKTGLELLIKALSRHLNGMPSQHTLHLPPQAGRLRARLFELGTVLTEQVDEQGTIILNVNMGRATLDRLLLKEGLLPEMLVDTAPIL